MLRSFELGEVTKVYTAALFATSISHKKAQQAQNRLLKAVCFSLVPYVLFCG